jgi:Skp family chaperone for outer membrane proteins
MNKKTILACCVTALVIMAAGIGGKAAKSDPEQTVSTKIGLVSVKRVFDQSKKNAKFEEQLSAEQEKVLADLEKARADIEAERAGLKTLKPGSPEHMGQVKVLMEKQAQLSAQQEFQKQNLAMKQRQWTEQMYGDIVRITGEIAQKRGLGVVLENSTIDLEDVPNDMLNLVILMRSVMYSAGCVDITDDVVVQLDAGK